MPLNEIQQEVYTDVCDLYAGELDLTEAADGFIKAVGVPTLVLAGVQFKLQQTNYAAAPSAIGRRYTANLMTNDSAFFAADAPVADAMFFQLKTPDHPQYGQWWAFQSDPQIHKTNDDFDPNYAEVFVKACTDPTELPSDSDL